MTTNATGELLDRAVELLRLISRRYRSMGLPDDPIDAVREFLENYEALGDGDAKGTSDG